MSKYGKIIARVRAREDARNERFHQEARSAFARLSMMAYQIKLGAIRGDLVTFPGSDVIDRPIVEPSAFRMVDGGFW